MKFQETFEKAVRNVEQQSSGTQLRRGWHNLRLGFEEAAAPGESPRIERETERKGERSELKAPWGTGGTRKPRGCQRKRKSSQGCGVRMGARPQVLQKGGQGPPALARFCGAGEVYVG